MVSKQVLGLYLYYFIFYCSHRMNWKLHPVLNKPCHFNNEKSSFVMIPWFACKWWASSIASGDPGFPLGYLEGSAGCQLQPGICNSYKVQRVHLLTDLHSEGDMKIVPPGYRIWLMKWTTPFVAIISDSGTWIEFTSIVLFAWGRQFK